MRIVLGLAYLISFVMVWYSGFFIEQKTKRKGPLIISVGLTLAVISLMYPSEQTQFLNISEIFLPGLAFLTIAQGIASMKHNEPGLVELFAGVVRLVIFATVLFVFFYCVKAFGGFFLICLLTVLIFILHMSKASVVAPLGGTATERMRNEKEHHTHRFSGVADDDYIARQPKCRNWDGD